MYIHTPRSLLTCFKKTSQPPKPIRNEKGIQPVFIITVDDPQKVGDPIRSFTMYTVHTRVTPFPYNNPHSKIFNQTNRPLLLYSKNPLSPSYDVILIFFGCTKLFPSTIQASLSHLFLKKTLSVDLMTNLCDSDGWHSRNVYRRPRTTLCWGRIQI